MYSISLQHSNPLTLISRIATIQKTKVENNKLFLDTSFVKGHFAALSFNNGIECLAAQYKLKQDFHLHKIPANKTKYILRIDEIRDSVNSLVEVEGKYTSFHNKNYTSTLLTSKQEFTFICSSNSRIRSVEIIIPVKWMEKKIIRKDALQLLSTYLSKNGINVQFDLKEINVKSHFNKIIQGSMLDNLALCEESISVLLEKYIINLNEKLIQKANAQKIKIVKDEIARLIAVKDFLIQDLSASPPSFSALTSLAAMSSTSLKTKFKKMYGENVYEFFQRKRMQKARVMLLTRRYSIKEIGTKLGYLNLSNFSIAYKKEFGELPSDLSKISKKMSFAAMNNTLLTR